MPWVSEFGYALHMAETGKRIMVGDGTVRRYVDSAHSGGLSLDDLTDNLVLEDPRAERIEGRRELESFMEASSAGSRNEMRVSSGLPQRWSREEPLGNLSST